MQQIIRITLLTISAILLIGTATVTKGQNQAEDSAKNIPQTVRVTSGDDCEVCAKRLDKVLTDLESSEKVIDALQTENESLRRLDTINTALITKKDEIIAGQNKLIKLTGKKAGKCFGLSIGFICAGFKY